MKQQQETAQELKGWRITRVAFVILALAGTLLEFDSLKKSLERLIATVPNMWRLYVALGASSVALASGAIFLALYWMRRAPAYRVLWIAVGFAALMVGFWMAPVSWSQAITISAYIIVGLLILVILVLIVKLIRVFAELPEKINASVQQTVAEVIRAREERKAHEAALREDGQDESLLVRSIVLDTAC
jgi:hypothetical protein